jgi:hypothetical protein
MYLVVGIAIGAALIGRARVETKLSWYAATDAESARHVKRARTLRIVGWVAIGVTVAIPAALIVLWTVFAPEFTF